MNGFPSPTSGRVAERSKVGGAAGESMEGSKEPHPALPEDGEGKTRRATDDKGLSTRPLAGLLVVSLEQAVAAPMCTCRLADAGARVIKIERPEGDFARGYDDLVHGECSYFVWLNRGKESIVLDLAKADDKALLATM